MDEIESIKKRIRDKKYEPKMPLKNNYINKLITRILISLILFFSGIILCNYNVNVRNFVKTEILTNNMSFSSINQIYTKYLGNVLPFKISSDDTKTVFNEKLAFNKIENYKDGFKLTVSDNYLVPSVSTGLVVFIGDKEGYGNTLIVQGIDEIDYWYTNVTNITLGLYDYVSEGDLIGTASGNYINLVFQKAGEYLSYDEVLG